MILNRYRIERYQDGQWSWRHLGGREEDNTRNSWYAADRVVRTLVASGIPKSELRIVSVPRDQAVTYNDKT